MLITNPTDLDFSQYKRMFTIGCSFTHWTWPTWADIIAREYDHLEYHNYGQPGCSNLYMLTMLSQLDRTFKFDKTDLVLIMFSSWHRVTVYNSYREPGHTLNEAIIDHDIKEKIQITKESHNWQSSDDLIGRQLLEKPAKLLNCDRGYAIQNYAVIDSITTIFKQSAYTGAYMQSVAPDKQGLFDLTSPNTPIEDVHQLYNDINEQALGISLYDYQDNEDNNHVWKNGEEDYHPYPSQYCKYLKALGVSISDSTQKWANFADQMIKDSHSPEQMETLSGWPYTKFNCKTFPL